MLAMLGNLVVCTLAGVLLAAVFLVPAGAGVGALNGLLVGVCVALANRKAKRNATTTATAVPIHMIGSHWDSRA